MPRPPMLNCSLRLPELPLLVDDDCADETVFDIGIPPTFTAFVNALLCAVLCDPP